ncbi:phosphoglycolate phosphatase, bacterial [gamma proteobacterium HTCC5015]|nr:phosphoglycolate phosphatase, bacterial [gamma proteobacterium HTCC5015]
MSVSEPVKALLFDLDGTLADTAADLIEATLRTMDDFGIARTHPSQLRPAVPNGSMALVEQAYGEGFAMLSDEQKETLRETLWQHYQNALYDNPTLYRGLAEAIDVWEQRGLPWGIVTNKPSRFAEPLLGALGLTERVSVWLGGDSLPRKKPFPDPLIEAARRLDLEPQACVYVGDDRRDVEASQAAHMPCIVAAWDFIPPGEDPHHWGANAVVENTGDLIAAIDAIR